MESRSRCARKAWERRKPQAETSRWNTAGNQPRPAELGQRPEASLAWCSGDRHCEAWTASERAVRLSPEIDIIAGADVVHLTEGRVAAPQWPGACDPAGVEEQGTLTGVPQEPGRPSRLLGKSRPEVPGDQLQALDRRARRPRERNAGAAGIPPREGNEARRDGRRGVGASNSTCEAGEPTRGTPWREGGAGP